MTITDRNDLQVALKEVVEYSDRLQQQHGGPKLPNMIPPLRIHATRAKSEVGNFLFFSLPCTLFYAVGMCCQGRSETGFICAGFPAILPCISTLDVSYYDLSACINAVLTTVHKL